MNAVENQRRNSIKAGVLQIKHRYIRHCMFPFLQKILPSRNDRLLKKYGKTVQTINALADEYRVLSDEMLCAKTTEFRGRLANGESLNDLLPQAFAAVREAADRVLDMRHFDVQLIGGMVLNDNKIAEMRTGEGKTLVATLAAYLNALPGKGVHIITVNDYLAKRDSEWMGKIYTFLGLTVGIAVSGQNGEERKQAYQSDIVYGTNNEFGFDYLRDNMALDHEQQVQRQQYYAIIDEVDSILIDEARTPLIISGPANDASDIYIRINKLVKGLRPEIEEGDGGDYLLEEKSKQVSLSEEGHQKIEGRLVKAGMLQTDNSLYDLDNIGLLHHVNSALRANTLFQKDVDYLIKDREILIVDEFTGRAMPGRRWSDGLHQAIEAKEGIKVRSENQTLASITFQNYFRLYERLSGMTGTADTEAYEFQDIYALETVIIPPHKIMIRDDMGDLVYMTVAEKFAAIVQDIKDCIERKQPVLVGTTSIEVSEYVSSLLKKEKIHHQVLNAKRHEAESQVIARAGQPGAVTIATNMAGRGTDIVLGGVYEKESVQIEVAEKEKLKDDWEQRHQQVVTAGGLHIIGTERHESRRIDNQLRGRSGRQGDPGGTRFYLSLEDNLMRIFAGDKVRAIMDKLGVDQGEAIEHPWVTRAIENAQKKVEAHNFDIRKNLLEYDDIANEQRKVIYSQRKELLSSEDVKQNIEDIIETVIPYQVDTYMPLYTTEWDVSGLESALHNDFTLDCPIQQWLDNDDALTADAIATKVSEQAESYYMELEQNIGATRMRIIEKILMLQVFDYFWKDHLAAMDHLRRGIGLRGFAQKNPRQEYKRESFEMFEKMLDRIRYTIISRLFRIRKNDEIVEKNEERKTARDAKQVSYQHQQAEDVLHADADQAGQSGASGKQAQARSASKQTEAAGQEPEEIAKVETIRREHPKIGRNDLCHCGSGKKYKKCHGKAA